LTLQQRRRQFTGYDHGHPGGILFGGQNGLFVLQADIIYGGGDMLQGVGGQVLYLAQSLLSAGGMSDLLCFAPGGGKVILGIQDIGFVLGLQIALGIDLETVVEKEFGHMFLPPPDISRSIHHRLCCPPA
jgi:hypothetical protein